MNFDAPRAHVPATGDRPRHHAPRPTPGPEQARPKQLQRDPDGLLGGVAAGIGAHLGIDPVIVRLGFLLGALWGGGVLAYIVCWVVIPMAQRSRRRRPPQLLGST
jgi:phage shock protein PspC (stress-responsive transcriptional regulator)